jgi:hypothetical protein
MLTSILLIFICQDVALRVRAMSPCSILKLSSFDAKIDHNYSIVANKVRSSNVVQVSLSVERTMNDTSWFIMGGRHESDLLGTWQPFTSIDGHIVECSSLAEQIVSNRMSSADKIDQSVFTFLWMAPPQFVGSVTFVAAFALNSVSADPSASLRYIQSSPITIEPVQGRQRLQDVSRSEFFVVEKSS